MVFDLDGTLTPVRSVWQYIHEALGMWDADARLHQAAFEHGTISYGEFCARDAAHWKGMAEAEFTTFSAANLRSSIVCFATTRRAVWWHREAHSGWAEIISDHPRARLPPPDVRLSATPQV